MFPGKSAPMASHFRRRHRTSATWRRLDAQYIQRRRLRAVAVGLSLALLGWTCWLAMG